LDIARAITAHGMRCTMTTGGYGLSRETARRMKEAGIAHVSVSVDGLEATHDRIRGRKGSFRFCFQTLGHFREVGLPFSANTQITRLSARELPELYERLRDTGARAWQVQLTSPMGNGADNAWMLMQPAELPDFYRMLARIALRARDEGKVALTPANDIGYYGPYDELIFSGLGGAVWTGCKAGLSVLGIHADGGIKGCPTLPSEYIGGNIRKQPLAEILETRELTFNTTAGTAEGTSHMWGFCGGCRYAAACRGGCSQLAHVLFNRRGNNPYCHYRTLELANTGVRERVMRAAPSPGKPFDHTVFELVQEPLSAPWPAEDDTHHFTYERVNWPAGWEAFPLPAVPQTRAAIAG
jgi:radical SAM protein with 4Fe4S-binding SPASM domain